MDAWKGTSFITASFYSSANSRGATGSACKFRELGRGLEVSGSEGAASGLWMMTYGDW